MAQDMMTSAEAAEVHGVHTTTWVRWVHKGLAPEPKVKSDRLYLFDPDEVRAFDIWDARKAEAAKS